MTGFDRTIWDQIEPERVLGHIKSDVRTDFIFAPHINAIFMDAGDEVWNRTGDLLKAGDYHPSLPYTISVPKGQGFTRPGSILSPVDRVVYQALIDLVTPELDEQLDRSRVFSDVFSQNEQKTLQSTHENWRRFQVAIRELCNVGGFIVKADIANYFERIPQHRLVNHMRAARCLPEAVNLLEKILLAFQGQNSFGIVQGVYPSDVLGDFFLSNLDAYFDLRLVRSARFNDDIYLQFGNCREAQHGLAALIERLRKDGLQLNESKSGILAAQEAIREETEVDDLFDAAREEVCEGLAYQFDGYGLTVEWEFEEVADEAVHLAAVEQLYGAIEIYPNQAEKILKFCLPILRTANSSRAVEGVLKRLTKNSHLTRLYYAYLSRFVENDQEIRKDLEAIVLGDGVVTNYERMYLLGCLLNANNIQQDTVNKGLRWLTSTARIAEETKAVAAIFAARHGNATQKHEVRVAYDDEPSEYVRSAILYSSRYMTPVECKTCRRAWGGHSVLNTLTSLVCTTPS